MNDTETDRIPNFLLSVVKNACIEVPLPLLLLLLAFKFLAFSVASGLIDDHQNPAMKWNESQASWYDDDDMCARVSSTGPNIHQFWLKTIMPMLSKV